MFIGGGGDLHTDEMAHSNHAYVQLQSSRQIATQTYHSATERGWSV